MLFAGRNRLYVSTNGGVFWRSLPFELPDVESRRLDRLNERVDFRVGREPHGPQLRMPREALLAGARRVLEDALERRPE